MSKKETRGRKSMPEKDRKTMFSFRCDPVVLKRLKQLAKNSGVNNSELAEDLLRQRLAKFDLD